MIRLDTARSEVGAISGMTGFALDFESLFSTAGDGALRRGAGAEHVTASCLIFDPDTEAVLLNHHRKAGLWGQFGGHLEPEDDSLRAAARREATEESGLSQLTWFSLIPIDLHVHDLSASFGACRRHFDVVFAAVADVDQVPVVSDESLAVKWFPLTDLPSSLMPDLVVRLPQLFRAGLESWRVSDGHRG
ncbi:MAG: NUDIX hydrolase [Brevibacterium sp.]|nr:NUDIX hydrolase [Brevibacterium sp.]MDN6158299.1 NUDIX hydrolase [Brevibacterium sp.]MDN6175391.1 NUDIX hydrolase [Brevibacterium sp.]MDN6527991.1 NUDIX hydrolase [Brevibacterium sp.]